MYKLLVEVKEAEREEEEEWEEGEREWEEEEKEEMNSVAWDGMSWLFCVIWINLEFAFVEEEEKEENG